MACLIVSIGTIGNFPIASVESTTVIEPAAKKQGPLGAQKKEFGNGLFVCEFPPMPQERTRSLGAASAQSMMLSPLEDTFLLHSNPGATEILYLDFNGFDGVHGDYTPWDTDGDPNTFSDAERTTIQETWIVVAEDFFPFDVDVTTEEPPAGWKGQRAVIDGARTYTYSWAYYGDWASNADREAYVFPGDDTWEWIGHSISHEVGHTLNLGHDGKGGTEYYQGHGSGDTVWCPIMGWGNDSLNTWDDGEYDDHTNAGQDDLATIDAVAGVDFRADDHGNDIGSATPVGIPISSSIVIDGLITERNDVDYFSFSTSGGDIQFSINEDIVLGVTNLDVEANIHDASGTVIHTSNPVDKLHASFDVTLAAGNYYLSIDGVGLGVPNTGYSDYGSIGYYSIYGQETSSGNPVPNVVGLSQAAAQSAITGAGFTVGTVSTDYSLTVPAGDVISQNPAGGTSHPSGTSVDMLVSLGVLFVNVPDVVGMAQATAESAIVAANLTVGNITYDYSNTVATGDVISQNPGGGASVAYTSPVDIHVSLGVQPVSVPNVVGNAQATAEAAIVAALLTVGNVTTDYSDTVPAGDVISQNPTGGSSVLPGTAVDLVVSQGVQMVTVPNVVGTAQASAEAAITAAVLTVGTITTVNSETVPAGDVISQSPIAGASVLHSTPVDLVVSLGVEVPLNIVLPANGGLLESFTSEYGSGWVASDLTNGVTNEDGWSCTANPTGPQEFVFSFENGDDKVLLDATIHGGLGEGQYFSKDVEVWSSADGTNYSLLGSAVLANSANSVVNIDLGSTTASKVKLVVTSGHRTDYWEIAEFIVNGINVVAGNPVPDVVGSTQAAAEAAITGAGFTVGNVTTEYSDTVAAGDVISQNPSAGTSLPSGSAVDLVVSLGVQMVTVPNVVGQAQATAEANIIAAILTVGNVTTAYSNTVAAGDVISSNPAAGASVVHDSSVDLVVSLGVEPATVPNVVGTNQTAAESAITTAGLVVGIVTTEYSDTVAVDDVISQNPSGGTTLPPGSSVDLVVSLGVQMVTVPNVVGQAQATAEANIVAAILTVGNVTTAYSNTIAAGNVISSNPGAGASVVHDSSVDLVVSLGVQPVTVPDVVGTDQTAAEAAIGAAGLAVGNVTTAYSDTVALDDVISQNPAAGTMQLPGTPVDLVVSLGVQMVTVPDVVGQAQAAAEANLVAAILTVGNVTTAYSNTVPAGDVISQSIAGGSVVVHDTAVDLVVSLGVEMVSVPNVVGAAQASAEASITSANLTVGTVSTEHSNTVAAGLVISQNPTGGSSVQVGTSVALVVSLGPPPVSVDDFSVAGDAYVKQHQAVKTINNQDLRVRSGASSRQIDSYLKFDVSGVGTVTNATLKLYSINVNMDVSVYQSANTTWTQNTITWDTAPGSTGPSIDTESVTTGWVEFDVTALVTGNGTVSFTLKGANNNGGRDFSSSTGPNPPVLTITHE